MTDYELIGRMNLLNEAMGYFKLRTTRGFPNDDGFVSSDHGRYTLIYLMSEDEKRMFYFCIENSDPYFYKKCGEKLVYGMAVLNRGYNEK